MNKLKSETKFQILLPDLFTREHERVLTIYLSEDHRLDTTSYQILYEAIDLLSQAEVKSDTASYTFRQAYDKYIDQPFADVYFEKL